MASSIDRRAIGALVAAGLLASSALVSPAEAASPITFYNYIGIFNVKDVAYGAKGDGSTDDTAAIQACMNAAAAAGLTGTTGGNRPGAEVFFPPGSYKVTAPLTNTVSNSRIRIRGAGKYITSVWGNINSGYIFDEVWQTSVGDIVSISDMSVVNGTGASNTAVDMSYGALRLTFPQAVISNILFSGTNGINCAVSNFSFNTLIVNCEGTGPGGGHVSGQLGYGSVGICVAQGTILSCNLSGYWVGMALANTGVCLLGSRTETCDTGVRLGYNPTGATSTLTAFQLSGHTTERCSTAYLVSSASNGLISGSSSSSGGTAPPNTVASSSWAAGVLTITSTVPLGWTGTEPITLESFTASGPGNPNQAFTATFIDSTHLSVPLASNPNITIQGSWSRAAQYGLQIIDATQLTVMGCAFGASSPSYEQAAIDLSNYSSTANTHVTLIGLATSGAVGWLLPTTGHKAQFRYINCDNPSTAFGFAELPGQANFAAGTPIEGMQFNITDCNTATWGATAAAGGANRVLVQYNGTNWTVVGK